MSVYRNKSRRTTDKWETVHVHSSTGKWDYGREVIKDSGFDAVILAEDIWALNGGHEYPSTFGYFDDGPPPSPFFPLPHLFPFHFHRRHVLIRREP